MAVTQSGGGAGRILANSSWRGIADLGSKVATAALFIVMARQVGDAQFGAFTFALSFAELLTGIGGLGLDLILARDIARDNRAARTMLATAFGLRLTIAALLLAAGLGVGSFFEAVDPEVQLLVLVLGISTTLDLLTQLCFGVFQGMERMGFVPIVLISQRWLTNGASIVVLLLGGSIMIVAGLFVAGSVFGLTLALTLVTRRIVRPRVHVDVSLWWTLIKESLPIGIAGISLIVLYRVNTTLLGAFETDAVVGNYTAAYRLLESTQFMTWAVSGAVFPVFARLTAGSRPSIGYVYDRSLKLILALTLPFAVGGIVLAEPTVELIYGSEFNATAGALAILAPTIVLYGLRFITSDLLIAQGRQRIVAGIYVAVLALNLALALILIPELSLDGAAIATTTSELVLFIALALTARKVHGPTEVLRIAAAPVAAALALAGVAWALSDTLVLALVAGALVYVGVLLAIERLAFPDDIAIVRGIIARRRGGGDEPADAT